MLASLIVSRRFKSLLVGFFFTAIAFLIEMIRVFLRRGVLIHVAPETLKRLKRLGLEQDRTLQALGLEALDTLLEKYGNPQ